MNHCGKVILYLTKMIGFIVDFIKKCSHSAKLLKVGLDWTYHLQVKETQRPTESVC